MILENTLRLVLRTEVVNRDRGSDEHPGVNARDREEEILLSLSLSPVENLGMNLCSGIVDGPSR